jgi:hypothetical protein
MRGWKREHAWVRRQSSASTLLGYLRAMGRLDLDPIDRIAIEATVWQRLDALTGRCHAAV